jgi:hypothetical protein
MPVASVASGAPTTRNAEIQEAAKDLADYQRLTAQGKLTEAGTRLDALKTHLNNLAAAAY